MTALLRRGDERYAEEEFSGSLPGGMQGQLAFYTYEEETRDSDGNKETTYFHFTIALTNLPETAPFMSELAMQRRSGFRFLDGAEDKFRKRQRVELESDGRRQEVRDLHRRAGLDGQRPADLLPHVHRLDGGERSRRDRLRAARRVGSASTSRVT